MAGKLDYFVIEDKAPEAGAPEAAISPARPSGAPPLPPRFFGGLESTGPGFAGELRRPQLLMRGPPHGIDPGAILEMLHRRAAVEIHDERIDAHEVETRRRELDADPKVRRHGIAMPMAPIGAVEAMGDGSPAELELTEDNAAAQAEARNWGLEALGLGHGGPFDGAGVTVAVIDSGLDPGHGAFAGIVFGPDDLKDFTGTGDPGDADGHGTHCAATIVGRPVGGRAIGVAPGVTRLLSARAFAPGVTTTARMVTQAMGWARAQEAHVISMSLSFDFMPFITTLANFFDIPTEAAAMRAIVEYDANLALFEAELDANAADDRDSQRDGAVIVAATGNHSRRRPPPGQPAYDVPAAPPAHVQDILSVGALRRGAGCLDLASFSNGHADLVAPGSGIVSAQAGTVDGLVAKSGTSMACPHVAGLAALYRQRAVQLDRPLASTAIQASLLDSARAGALCSGIAPIDRGSGMPQAPQILN